MRLSQFSIFIDLRECGALFNTVTGCMDLFTGPLYQELKKLPAERCTSKDPGLLSPGREIRSTLIRRGHVIRTNPDEELAMFRAYALLLERQNRWLEKQSGYIMLLLSYECNFDCTYCYQRNFRSKVEGTRFVTDDIDRIFGSYQTILCPGVDQYKVYYVLYGGEPLLPRNRNAVERTLQLAAKQGSSVEAITNGYCLDSYLDLLGREPGKISRVQISFDSDQSLHDRRRVLRSGHPTFEKILHNLTKAVKTDVDVQISCHMHDEHGASLTSFLALLRERGILERDNTQVYVSPIKHDFPTSENDPLKERCLSSQDLCDLAPSIGSDVANYYQVLSNLSVAETGRGPANTAYCMRSKENCYVIDPVGGIYSCYEEAGRPEYRVAAHDKDGPVFLPYRETTLSETVAHRDSLYNSPFSLITGGGCAVTGRRNRGSGQGKLQDDEHREFVMAALRRVFSEVLSKVRQQANLPEWLPINYVHDDDRSLQALIVRFSQFADRGLK